MTKAVVAAAAAGAIEDGLLPLGLATEVASVLPEFGSPLVIEVCGAREPSAACPHEEGRHRYRLVPALRNITVEDLLTHRAGFTYSFFRDHHLRAHWKPEAEVATRLLDRAHVLSGCHVEGIAAERAVDNTENVMRISRVPLASQPGSEFTYGHDTDVLGRVLEVVEGTTLGAVLQRRLFEPLGMNDTMFSLGSKGWRRAKAAKQRLAPLFHFKHGEPVRCGTEGAADWCANAEWGYEDGLLQSGGCGLLSTARDYLTFLKMLLSGGRSASGERVLGRAAVHAMTHGDRLALEDWPFRNLDPDSPRGGAPPSEGWGLGFALGGSASRRPSDQLEAKPIFRWEGLHSTQMFGSHGERLAAVALTQCHGYDAYCHDRSSEMRKGLRDVVHSMLP
eukprot:6029388-Prymnesium_polylepis.1